MAIFKDNEYTTPLEDIRVLHDDVYAYSEDEKKVVKVSIHKMTQSGREIVLYTRKGKCVRHWPRTRQTGTNISSCPNICVRFVHEEDK